LINIEETIDSIITSRLVTINASLDTANAQIIDLQILKVTEDQAIAIAINQISSELYSPGGVLFGAITNIQVSISSLDGKVDDNYTDLIDLNESTAYVLTVEINRVEASIEGVATAVIEDMDLAYASDVEAVALSVTTLRSEIQGGYASIEDAMTAYVGADEVIASSVTTLRADMDGEFAAVEVEIEAIVSDVGAIGSRYGVRLVASATNPEGGASQIVGGFELLNNGADVSAGFDVDVFWVGRVGTTGKRPFLISGGVVYIDTTVIQDGTITNAKIGNIIQSTPYEANVFGWQINKNGNAYFNNIYARGDIRASSLTSNLIVTDSIRSSNFNLASPATSPGWGIYEDGRAYFANPVISRPNVVASGTFTATSAQGYATDVSPSFPDFWYGGGANGPIVDTYTTPDTGDGSVTYVRRDLVFYVDVPRSTYAPDSVGNISGKLLTAQAFVTATTYYHTGSDPGAGGVSVYDTIAEAHVMRVSQFTSGEGGSYIRIKITCPLPLNIHPLVYQIEYNSIIWSLSEFS
jgi:hypothetical protein